jgi:predicted acetyltransferase
MSPNLEYQSTAATFVLEFRELSPDFHGFGLLEKYECYPDWLIRLENDKKVETCLSNRVPSETFFVINTTNNEIVGIVNIRYYLNEDLLMFGGHIGISIRPTLRNQGYGTKALGLALNYCKEIGIDKVLITCHQDNQSSANMIKNNGGVFENELIEENGTIIQRYWVDLSK